MVSHPVVHLAVHRAAVRDRLLDQIQRMNYVAHNPTEARESAHILAPDRPHRHPLLVAAHAQPHHSVDHLDLDPHHRSVEHHALSIVVAVEAQQWNRNVVVAAAVPL